jgi:hypothetical protein
MQRANTKMAKKTPKVRPTKKVLAGSVAGGGSLGAKMGFRMLAKTGAKNLASEGAERLSKKKKT